VAFQENGVEIRRRISIMPESPGLYLRLSVTENLECFADLYEAPHPHDRIGRALRAVNLTDRANDACGTLSKGLRQRVASLPTAVLAALVAFDVIHPALGAAAAGLSSSGCGPAYATARRGRVGRRW
jgi:ABC-type Na+ transport system ATPase subunit NatA